VANGFIIDVARIQSTSTPSVQPCSSSSVSITQEVGLFNGGQSSKRGQ
jgi:hypothetical protein